VFRKLLIANRGEIAVRIARAAADLGIEALTVYSEDDEASGHVRSGDVAHRLNGRGAAAYLDGSQIIATALAHGCDAVHPGYGFLSENSSFAQACGHAGVKFVGPRPEIIDLFGDKTRARALAKSCDVPVLDGTDGPASLEEIEAFLAALGPGGAVMVKAVAGGGGRGMRAVEDVSALAEAVARCRSEARRSFGSDEVYAERLIRRARHIEVQIVGDGHESVHLWERECTLQRQNQKLIEFAPSPSLSEPLRERLVNAAQRMARAAGYDNLGTFEFLIDLDQPDAFAFIEANPRLQVEHTVTEEVLGRDLVRLQLEIASGRTLADLNLAQADVGRPRGFAIQLRVNLETMDRQGRPRPSMGTIAAFAPPGGPGVRVDTFGYAGYRTVASFDSLLAKLIVRSTDGGFAAAIARARRAAREFAIDGVATNLPFLQALLGHPDVAANAVHTSFIEERIAELLPPPKDDEPAVGSSEGWRPIRAHLTGVIASLSVAVGDKVAKGAQIAVLEAMKLEHVVTAETGGIVRGLPLSAGDQIAEGEPIALIEEQDIGGAAGQAGEALDLDRIRDDLATVRARLGETLDEGRAAAVARRRARRQRTARENIADLADPGSFIEYGQLALANQRQRRTPEQLREMSPADGFVMGLATVGAERFGAERSQVAVGAYDFTVFAGTQGHVNHKKTDRLFELAAERKIPLVLFAEGGGGRPGEDSVSVAGLDTETFASLARLSGEVPTAAIVSGRCFAGNAALVGCVDVVIATEDSNIGMGGPALIEAAGLGDFPPEAVGPIDVQSRNGVVDIRVADEAAAVAAARQYLSYFQGRAPDREAADPRLLRQAIPENRLRAYDVLEVARLIADTGSFLELRAGFGRGYVTALVRLEGRPMGLMANNPLHMAGAIDSDGADKAARFMRLCDAHGLPILSLIDTPGIMVGPEAEKTGLVRHAARLFLAGARLAVPVFAVILRKAYGLGAMASAGGHFRRPVFTIAWPTGEIGGMGLEGAVRLGYRREMEAIADPAERKAWFEAKVAALYDKGKALNAASYFELDAVIDPAETRQWIARGLDAAGPAPRGGGVIDAW
jgi:acetyl/propionyl-CoA carboxylase alpha subunit/acetyl-CoA carboxylase carboxyltransferase component